MGIKKVAWAECDAPGCDERYDLVGDQLRACIALIEAGWSYWGSEEFGETRKLMCPLHRTQIVPTGLESNLTLGA